MSKGFRNDLTGKTFDYWTVLEFIPDETTHHTIWKCQCICGNIKNIYNKPISKSCGCLSRDNLINQIFDKLTVVKPTQDRQSKSVVYECRCECGIICYKTAQYLKHYNNHSCGCNNKQKNEEEFKGRRFGKLVAIQPTIERTDTQSVIWECLCDCGEIIKVPRCSLTSGSSKTSCGCSRYKDLKNQRFGRLTVINICEERSEDRCIIWNCRCDCGVNVQVKSKLLLSRSCQSCGCLRLEQLAKAIIPDLIGKEFGRLTVIEKTDKRLYRNVIWNCQCNCGSTKLVEATTNSLTTGHIQSCGCLQSIGEMNIKLLLEKNNIIYETEVVFDDLVSNLGYPLRFDFLLQNEDDNIYLIEFDGIQHFTLIGRHTLEKLSELQERDHIKNQYCFDNNIPLIRIPFWERDNLTIDMLKLETCPKEFIVSSIEHNEEIYQKYLHDKSIKEN